MSRYRLVHLELVAVRDAEMTAHDGQVTAGALGLRTLNAEFARVTHGQAGHRPVQPKPDAAEPPAKAAADVEEAEMQPRGHRQGDAVQSSSLCFWRRNATATAPTVPTFKHTPALLE